MEQPFGPALDVDSRPAFLFEEEGGDRLGVSLRTDGGDLPVDDAGRRWIYMREFRLGVHEAVPEAIDPEPIIRGIQARGFFVWQRHRTEPFGTSQ